ncbi:MAG: hypothetical protein MI866_14980 [Bacteroidales bacterium]|nr:hypothetical protein [Bacteroidales bacterium]
MTKVKNLLLVLLAVVMLLPSCNQDLKDEIDDLKKELELKEASLSDLEAKKAELEAEKGSLEGDNAELNAKIAELETMISNRYVENHISLVYKQDGENLTAYAWKHLYDENYKLSMSIRTYVNADYLTESHINDRNFDGTQSKLIITHNYQEGVLTTSSSDEGEITWNWAEQKVESFTVKEGVKTLEAVVSDNLMNVESAEVYEGDVLVAKLTYEYNDDNLITSEIVTDAQDVELSKMTYAYDDKSFLTKYVRTDSDGVLKVEWAFNDDFKLTYYYRMDPNHNGFNESKETIIKLSYNTDASFVVDHYYMEGTYSPIHSVITYDENGRILKSKNLNYDYISWDSNELYVYQTNETVYTYDNGVLIKEETTRLNYDTDEEITGTAIRITQDLVYFDESGEDRKSYTEILIENDEVIYKEEFAYVYIEDQRWEDYKAEWAIEAGEATYISYKKKNTGYWEDAPYAPKYRTITTYTSANDNGTEQNQENLDNAIYWDNWVNL